MKPLVRLLLCLLSIFLPLASGKTPANTYLACSPCQGLLYGDQVTIGVLVVPDGTGPAPTGPATVTWDSGTAQVPLDSYGHGTLIFPSSSLPPLSAGTHIFSSAYSDAYYQAGLPAAVSVEVSKAETILIMGFLATYINQPTTLRAVIKLSNYSTAPVSGTVNFTSNGNPIGGCTGVPVSGGEATCHPTFSQPGSITIGFAYSGDSNTNPSSNSGSLTIFKMAANAYVAATPTAPAYGDPTSIGVLVTGASGAPTPSGTVTVSWGASPVTAPLDSGGHASLPLPSLGAGNYSIAATYNGDPNYQTASAASLQLVVGKAGTTVTVGSGPVQIDQPITLKASVSLANWASLAVTGTVDFTKNGGPLAGCTGVPLAAGAALCNTIFPQAGSFTIGATYSGDANANPSSGSTQLTVGKMAATAYVAASPASPTYGDAITIGLLVSGATGAPTPTGTASIVWGAATLSATLDSTGRGSVMVPSASLPLPAAGSYTITGGYNGDSNYQAAPAAPFQLVVSKAGTAVTMSSSALQINQPVTLRATVSLANWANMPVSGTVDFSMGGSPLGAVRA